MSKMDERVLCVRRSLFDELGAFEGLSSNVEHYLVPFLNPENNLFLPRSIAETDPSHKQLIPYVVLTYQGRILHYVRGGGGGEKRLRAKGSIGIGGHINDQDAQNGTMDRTAYKRSVQREISEELQIKGNYSERIVAMLNDDSEDVGKVHLGVVHIFELETDNVASNEDSICELEFLSPEALSQKKTQLETWSQIVFNSWDRLHLQG